MELHVRRRKEITNPRRPFSLDTPQTGQKYTDICERSPSGSFNRSN
jgi:hypothetical protein